MSSLYLRDYVESYRLRYDLKTHRLLCLMTPEALRAVLIRLNRGGERLMHHTKIWHVPIGPFLREPERWGYSGCMTFERDASPEGPAWVCDFSAMEAKTDIERKQHMIRIACSFSVLLDALNATLVSCESPGMRAEHTQFATLKTYVNDRDIGSFPLGGELSADARARLEQKARAEDAERASFLNRMFLAMRNIHSCLDPEYHQRIESQPRMSPSSCSDITLGASFISTGWRINLQSMGGSIFINPECEEYWRSSAIRKVTAEFGCHNTDGPLHQLPLVAGYAAMWEALAS